MTTTYYVDTMGDLHDYRTGEYIRPATPAEQRASDEAAEEDGGSGVLAADEIEDEIPADRGTLR